MRGRDAAPHSRAVADFPPALICCAITNCARTYEALVFILFWRVSGYAGVEGRGSVRGMVDCWRSNVTWSIKVECLADG